MTALTPQQMRALAMDAVISAENADRRDQTGHAIRYRKMAAALRTAADQLEAVREWADSSDREPNWDALNAILTADTTPQDAS